MYETETKLIRKMGLRLGYVYKGIQVMLNPLGRPASKTWDIGIGAKTSYHKIANISLNYNKSYQHNN